MITEFFKIILTLLFIPITLIVLLILTTIATHEAIWHNKKQ